MKNLLVFGLLALTVLPGVSQVILQGKVIHSRTSEALPFVNLSVRGTNQGTTADVEGRFNFTWAGGEADLIFSYVGFESFTYHFSPPENNFLLIRLNEKPTELHEVVIYPGENPALQIIRKVIRNKPLNDPENLSSFSYRAYNKLYLTVDGSGDSAKNKTEEKFEKFAARNYMFVNESYSERKYVKPNLTKETILANRMSGVKDPFFAVLATDFQPFSFYKEFIPVLSTNYLNPISPGSPDKYDFTISDTLYHGKDSVFVVAFEPFPGRSFDALKGQLYISTDGYAVEHVIAYPADTHALLEFRLHQKYAKTDGHWFPVQINSELRLTEYRIGNQKATYVDRSYLTDIHIGIKIPKKEFGLLNVEFDPLANRRPESFWNAHRNDSLGVKEKNTYRFYDSLGPKLKALNIVVKTLEGLAVGRFRAGSFYIPLEHLLRVNQYEGVRLGVGLQTGEKISKHFVLEGNAGYGFKDRALKYGGAFQWNAFPRKDGFLRISYKQDISEPGGSNFIRSPLAGSETLRNWMAARMDSIEQYKGEFTIRPVRFSQVSVALQRQNRNPTYDYLYTSNAFPGHQNFIVTEAIFQWRFARRENYVQIGNGKSVTSMVYPQINLYASRGMTGVWDGQYAFSKFEIKIDQQWLIRNFGKTTIQLDAGKIQGQVPYPFLFNGKGSNFSQSIFNNVLVSNYFQTMGLYEFASDQFAYLFMTHNFGRLTGTNSKLFRPELAVVHNMGVGSLKNKDFHQGVVFKTMEKGYFESGLMFSNIIRFEYLKLFYYGVGTGAFYRYGNYALPNVQDNFTFKIIFSITF
jgi:Family of unknown function (DUF5686)/CarboxypepD_reg-like domain